MKYLTLHILPFPHFLFFVLGHLCRVRCMILCFLLSLSEHLNYIYYLIFLNVFCALSGFNTQKAYGPDGVPCTVPQICASVLISYLVKLFHLFYKLPSPLVGSIYTFSLSLWRMTTLILQAANL